MWKPTLVACVLILAAACGEEKKQTNTVITVEPTPRDAVAEIKLQLEDFRTYYYCELSYPKTCDDLPVAYVLEREGDEGPFRVVFFNNQDMDSTFAIFDYVTIDMETKTIGVEGQFQWCNRCSDTAGYVEKGTPMWGVPK